MKIRNKAQFEKEYLPKTKKFEIKGMIRSHHGQLFYTQRYDGTAYVFFADGIAYAVFKGVTDKRWSILRVKEDGTNEIWCELAFSTKKEALRYALEYGPKKSGQG